MKPKLLLSLALFLSNGAYSQVAVAEAPGKSASPAAKDAYVAAQLAQLCAGAPVQLSLRGALLPNTLAADVSAGHANGTSTNGSVTKPYCLLSVFDSKSAARDEVKSAMSNFQPTASTKTNYDEFYSGKRGEMIEMVGRHGTAVVKLYSSASERLDTVFAEGLDSIFDAIGTNISLHPALLSNLVHYAYTRHFGDPAPLHSLLSKLTVPELSAAMFPAGPSYGENAVTATYQKSDGHELKIIAKAYDSVEAAKEGQESDSRRISVSADKTEIIQDVEVHEYTRYGGIYFQVGVYTFRFEGEDAMPSQLKVASALIDKIKQVNSRKENSF